MMGLAYFLHTMFRDNLSYLLPENVSEIFLCCTFSSKNKLEIIELFGIFDQIVKT